MALAIYKNLRKPKGTRFTSTFNYQRLENVIFYLVGDAKQKATARVACKQVKYLINRVASQFEITHSV